jgi:hypothetical protein
MAFFTQQDLPTSPARIGVIATGIYLFTAFYSSGEGPVPFTYRSVLRFERWYCSGSDKTLRFLAAAVVLRL